MVIIRRNEISADIIRARIETQGQHTYADKVTITKGITLLLGVYSYIFIFDHYNKAAFIGHLIFLGATCAISLIPVFTYAHGLLLHGKRQNILDELTPWGMMALEILLFLTVQNDRMFGAPYDLAWFWLVGVQTIIAIVLILNRLLLFDINDFVNDLRPLATRYRFNIYGDFVGASIFATIALGTATKWNGLGRLSASFEVFGYRPNAVAIIAFLLGLLALFICCRASIYRERIKRELDNI